MPNFLRSFWLAIRRWPVYAGLAALGLGAFEWAGLRGYRLLGDDNESTETLGAPGTRGSHGSAGHGLYFHK